MCTYKPNVQWAVLTPDHSPLKRGRNDDHRLHSEYGVVPTQASNRTSPASKASCSYSFALTLPRGACSPGTPTPQNNTFQIPTLPSVKLEIGAPSAVGPFYPTQPPKNIPNKASPSIAGSVFFFPRKSEISVLLGRAIEIQTSQKK